VLPRIAKSIADKELPKFAMPKTERDDPMRVKLRTDRPLPSQKASLTEREDPRLATPKIDREDPIRINCRRDIELPRT